MEVDYKKIFTDIIIHYYPSKLPLYQKYIDKLSNSSLDIILLNNLIFGKNNKENKYFKAYLKEDILQILEFQYINNLSNTATASIFNICRNTVSSWKKKFKFNNYDSI